MEVNALKSLSTCEITNAKFSKISLQYLLLSFAKWTWRPLTLWNETRKLEGRVWCTLSYHCYPFGLGRCKWNLKTMKLGFCQLEQLDHLLVVCTRQLHLSSLKPYAINTSFVHFLHRIIWSERSLQIEMENCYNYYHL